MENQCLSPGADPRGSTTCFTCDTGQLSKEHLSFFNAGLSYLLNPQTHTYTHFHENDFLDQNGFIGISEFMKELLVRSKLVIGPYYGGSNLPLASLTPVAKVSKHVLSTVTFAGLP